MGARPVVRGLCAAALVVALVVAGMSIGLAQVPSAPARSPSPAAPSAREPSSASGAAPSRPSLGASVFVRRFELRGNTRWSSDDLRARVLAPFEGRLLTTEDLETARRRLTQWYVEHGHVNSGARIPDQTVADGVVVLEVVEGRLTRIDVSGTRHLNDAVLTDRLWPAARSPLDVGVLADRVRQLQQRPMIERLRANLSPGSAPGESILSLDVVEAPPWQAGMTVANNRSPSIGPVRAQLFASARSLTGRDDPLLLRLGLAKRLDDIGVDYALPLNADDLTLTLRADSHDSLVVEAPFSDLDIRSRTRVGAIGLTWPFATSADRGQALGVVLEHKRNDTWLLGERFSFSPGVRDGHSAVTVLRVFHEAYRRSSVEALAVRAGVNVGVDAFGATTGAEEPDGRFVTVQGQLQWLRRAAEGTGQLYVRSDLQWASEALLPLERVAVGGAATVRGYRENLLVRDQALILSVEWRQPLDRWLPRLPDPIADSRFQLAPFVDAAVTRNRGGTTPAPRSLASIGVAGRWNLAPYAYAELAYGRGLRRVSPRGDDLQDRGWHFRVTAQTR